MLFDPVFDVLVGLLKGLIDANEIGERGVLVHAVRAMPLLCREARDEARKDASFPYLMAYCRTLFDVGTPYHRYCDRLPPAVDPAVLSEAITSAERGVVTELEDALKARAVVVRDIDAATTPNVETPPGELSPTVPPNLPAKVKLFLYHLGNFHARYSFNPVNYNRHYRPCARKGCQRPAWVPIPEHVQRQATGAHGNVADNAKNERCYWHMCHSGDMTGVNPYLPANLPFCSGECYCVTRDEYDRDFNMMARLPHLAGEGSLPPTRCDNTDATPSRLYRAALARNMSLNRLVRMPPDFTLCKHYPATPEGARAMHRAFIDALNVDLGVLYAANVVHQLPDRQKPNTALPKGTNWRTYPVFYTNAIATVRAIYLSERKHEGMAKGSEKWLGVVHARVRQVFA